jgi:hypothetical protein
MNPLLILLVAVATTSAAFIANYFFPISQSKKITALVLAGPMLLGVLGYGGYLIAAQFVYRDALAATRTVHAEWEIAASTAPTGDAPDFGTDYASLVKHGQIGTTTTSNGYDVTMKRSPENTFTATVTKDGKPYSEVTTDDVVRFNPDQQWVTRYPFWFQAGI